MSVPHRTLKTRLDKGGHRTPGLSAVPVQMSLGPRLLDSPGSEILSTFGCHSRTVQASRSQSYKTRSQDSGLRNISNSVSIPQIEAGLCPISAGSRGLSPCSPCKDLGQNGSLDLKPAPRKPSSSAELNVSVQDVCSPACPSPVLEGEGCQKREANSRARGAPGRKSLCPPFPVCREQAASSAAFPELQGAGAAQGREGMQRPGRSGQETQRCHLGQGPGSSRDTRHTFELFCRPKTPNRWKMLAT